MLIRDRGRLLLLSSHVSLALPYIVSAISIGGSFFSPSYEIQHVQLCTPTTPCKVATSDYYTNDSLLILDAQLLLSGVGGWWLVVAEIFTKYAGFIAPPP